MIDLPSMLEIVRTDEAREIRDLVGCVAACVILFLALLPAIRVGFRKFAKHGIAFVAISLGFLYAMANKPPKVVWDAGLTNNGSEIYTNEWSHVTFRWTKAAYITGGTPLYFAAKANDAGPDIMPSEIGDTTAGALSWDYTWPGGENATNYTYYAYLAGSGGGTNNVWTGDILIKAKGPGAGIDKMVIIRSNFFIEGEQILPFKKEDEE